MLKISNKASINLSIAISISLFVLCIAGTFILPTLCELLINLPDNIGNRDAITDGGRIFVLVCAYLILATIVFANVQLLRLLLRVKSAKVFSPESVSLIRCVSWSCYILCGFFCCLGYYFQLAFIVAFLGFFLGLCLRVTKNVIAEATEIKDENDLTV